MSACGVAAPVHAGGNGVLEHTGICHGTGLGGGPAAALLPVGLGLRCTLAFHDAAILFENGWQFGLHVSGVNVR